MNTFKVRQKPLKIGFSKNPVRVIKVPSCALKLFSALLLIAIAAASVSADTIASVGFEASGDTWGYTSNSVFPYNISGNVWAPQAARTIPAPQEGSQFWCAQDLREVNTNGNGGALTEFYLEFSSVDISSYNSVQITFYYNGIALDPDENIFYQIDTGGGFGAEVLIVEPAVYNVSTSGWELATIDIPDSAETVSLRLGTGPGLIGTGAAENIGFDNVVLSGTLVPEPMSLGLLGIGVAALLRKRRK